MTLDQVDLKQRLEYLSRAIMCVKSGELGGESSRVGVGELLHDLEEKMEVARVQLQIVDALSGEHMNNRHFSSAFGQLLSTVCSLRGTYFMSRTATHRRVPLAVAAEFRPAGHHAALPGLC